VKVVDFGLAKVQGEREGNETTVGRLLGTPVYMAPERLLGLPYDGGADVYAVGMTLFEILAGRVPFATLEGGIGALVLACVQQEVPSIRTIRSDVPAALDDAIARSLRKTPLARPTMAALLRALEEVSGRARGAPAATRDDPIAGE
jgi:serine/threonine-protein kinase